MNDSKKDFYDFPPLRVHNGYFVIITIEAAHANDKSGLLERHTCLPNVLLLHLLNYCNQVQTNQAIHDE